ncbi:carboxypeptidase N subunit 2-like [Saccostrea echinata]|uniref:carboxypeptidase N subunit 2-like n=1 Tax=Saccostrea echinata TaxID=191078 RepID=UPI002A807325|nr:carboxypeptidase N subunit 2-like [Saccostrea echinata]
MNCRNTYEILFILSVCVQLVYPCPQYCDCSRWSEVRCQQVAMNDVMSNLPPGTMRLEVKQTTSSSLTSLDFNTSYSVINNLKIYNSYIQRIDDGTFSSLRNLQTLNLTRNNLRTISKNAFRGLTQLTKLDLSHNGIQNIDEVFYSVDRLQMLYINRNSLTAIRSGAFSAQKQLQYLQLDGNEFQSLTVNSFSGLSSSLQTLYMRGCELNTMGMLLSLRQLKLLDLGENAITKLPSNSQLRQAFPQLRFLFLDRNGFTRLADGQFSNMNLDTLDLASNRLDQVTNILFSGSSVQHLNLSNNAIINVGESAFKQIKSLNSLNLAQNPIGTFPRELFRGIFSLRELNLSACALNSLSEDQFKEIYLFQLDISRNSLPFLPQGLLDRLTMISKFYIYENPWHCDCRIAPLKQWLERFWTRSCNPVQFPVECQAPLCMSPLSLTQRPITDLTADEINTCKPMEQVASADTGLAVGLAVGAVLLCLLVAIIIFIICRRRKNNKPGGQFHLCKSPASDVTSHNEEFEKSSKPQVKPFSDGDQVSIQSDKSFVVRHFFQTMVSTDPSAMSNPPERMRRDTFRTTYSGSNPSLASSAYSYPIGRETAI